MWERRMGYAATSCPSLGLLAAKAPGIAAPDLIGDNSLSLGDDSRRERKKAKDEKKARRGEERAKKENKRRKKKEIIKRK